MKRAMLLLFGLICVSGCGGGSDLPELGEVSGVVTLDGEPLPNAIVYFNPTDGGRPSTAETDDEGYYELMYLEDAEGAIVGQHTVRVEPVITDEMEAYDPENPAAGGEPPPVYPESASNGSITEEVTAGDNTIDIALISDE